MKSTATIALESTAEHTGRPLYAISGGDFGRIASQAEKQLFDASAPMKRWNAVALIDEADVFMQERTLNDLERNELVSGRVSSCEVSKPN